MNKTNKVHIKGNGSDLRFSMKGLKAIACGGTHNIPDGECFSAPVKNSVEGVIRYNAPTIYQGIAFDDIELTFEKGKVIKASANNSKSQNTNNEKSKTGATIAPGRSLVPSYTLPIADARALGGALMVRAAWKESGVDRVWPGAPRSGV